jgi:hypothetical protein
MRLSRSCAFLVASAMLVPTHAAAQSAPVSIQFQNGNVTVRTTGRTPLRTVLQEWARVGRARIVNAESVTVTLEQIELVNVPEQQALSVLLREVSGYAIGEREALSSGPSRFDRIMLLPRSTSATNAPRVAGVTTAPPPPIAFVPGDPDDDPNDLPPNAVVRPLTPQQQQQQITNAAALAAARAQQQQQQQQLQQQNSDRNPSEQGVPRPATAPTNTPANPFFNGTSGRPGEITPVPQQRAPLRPNGDPEP